MTKLERLKRIALRLVSIEFINDYRDAKKEEVDGYEEIMHEDIGKAKSVKGIIYVMYDHMASDKVVRTFKKLAK